MYGNHFRARGRVHHLDMETAAGVREFRQLAMEQRLHQRARGLGHRSTFELLRHLQQGMIHWEMRSEPLEHWEQVEVATFPEYITAIDNVLRRVSEVNHHTGDALARVLEKIEIRALAYPVINRMCNRLREIGDSDMRYYAEELLNRKCGKYGEYDPRASIRLIEIKRDQARQAGDGVIAAMLDKLLKSTLSENLLTDGKARRGNIKTIRAQDRLALYESSTRGLSGSKLRKVEDDLQRQFGYPPGRNGRHRLTDLRRRARETRGLRS